MPSSQPPWGRAEGSSVELDVDATPIEDQKQIGPHKIAGLSVDLAADAGTGCVPPWGSQCKNALALEVQRTDLLEPKLPKWAVHLMWFAPLRGLEHNTPHMPAFPGVVRIVLETNPLQLLIP